MQWFWFLLSPLWLVVAVWPTSPVVGIAKIILTDETLSVVWGQDQIFFEHLGPEFPALGEFQTTSKVLEALVGLVGI